MIHPIARSFLVNALIVMLWTAVGGAATVTVAPKTGSQPAAAALPSPGAPPAAPRVIAGPPPFGVLPGQFAIRTMLRNTYLTARDGGHHSIDAVVTSAVTPGPYEKFTIEKFQPSYTLLKTAGGYYVSAAGGGGRGGDYDDTQTMQTERTALADDALFRTYTGIPGWQAFTIQTYNGHYLTALGGGGKSTRAFHTDATKPSTWEYFWIAKCGDLGTEYDYAIVPKGAGQPLTVTNGGGLVKNAVLVSGGATATAKFRLSRQSDGQYALQTPNRVNYVTAIQGGGLASGTKDWDNLVTDRTQVQAWEKFRIVDRGDCTYTIQTTNNWFIATSGARISTRISDPAAAPTIGYNAYFELAPFIW